MSMERSVLKLRKTGDIRDLRVESDIMGQLAPGEVRVDVHAVRFAM